MANLIPFPITPPPGVVVTESNRVVEGRWTAPFDGARFVNGKPQKIGGNTAVATTAMSGIPRAIGAWGDTTYHTNVVIGTSKKIYLYTLDASTGVWGAQSDVTPVRSTGTLGNNPFTTTSGSAIVTVAHTAHGAAPGDQVTYAGASAVGGLTLNGVFTVTSYISANSYTITAGSPAGSNATGGGAAVTFSYQINIGVDVLTTTVFGVLSPTVWSFDAFGTVMIAAANVITDQIYYYIAGTTPVFTLIAGSPSIVRGVCVTPERFVFALVFPMTLSSCSQGDYTDWTPSSANTAFSRTLSPGTLLVCARVLAPYITLVWSDKALFRFQYTGSAFLYESTMVAKDCGCIGQNAAVTVNGAAYWMGWDNFYQFDGAVRPMANVEDIRKYVFDNANSAVGQHFYAQYYPALQEIWVHYSTVADGLSPGHYVIFHIPSQVWSIGTMARSASIYLKEIFLSPAFFRTDQTGNVYQHETGTDDNGSALSSTVTIGAYAIGEGTYNVDVEGVLLDLKDQVGAVTLTATSHDRLTDPSVEDTESETVTPSDGLTDLRVSGRYLTISMNSNVVGGYYRWGKPAAFIRQQGKRS